MVTKITTGKSLNSLLSAVIEESLKSALHNRALEEKEQQDSLSSTQQQASPEEPKQSKTTETDREVLSGGDVSVDDVIEKLNTIRSGKSFKDETIKGNMTQYVDSLAKAEKVALLAFLKGIAQIVTGEIPAKTAVEPSDNPADVEMKKGNEPHTKHIKPNVIKTSIPKNKEEKKEDDSAPTPVKVKK